MQITEEKNVGARKRNKKFFSCRRRWTRRDDGIFITTRFAPGIILETYPRELSRVEKRSLPLAEELHTGNEFACRQHVFPTYSIFFMPRRGALMRKTCCENLRTKICGGYIILSVTYPRNDRDARARVRVMQSRGFCIFITSYIQLIYVMFNLMFQGGINFKTCFANANKYL